MPRQTSGENHKGGDRPIVGKYRRAAGALAAEGRPVRLPSVGGAVVVWARTSPTPCPRPLRRLGGVVWPRKVRRRRAICLSLAKPRPPVRSERPLMARGLPGRRCRGTRSPARPEPAGKRRPSTRISLATTSSRERCPPMRYAVSLTVALSGLLPTIPKRRNYERDGDGSTIWMIRLDGQPTEQG